MDVNFFGHVVVTQKLLDAIPDDGCIIATSSVQGKLPIPYRSAYGASKHAFQVSCLVHEGMPVTFPSPVPSLQAFFDVLRCESRPNLHILTVSAGYMNTGFGSRALDVKGEPVGKDDANQAKVSFTLNHVLPHRSKHVLEEMFIQRAHKGDGVADFFSLVQPRTPSHVFSGSFQSGPIGQLRGSGTGKTPGSRSGLGTSSMR